MIINVEKIFGWSSACLSILAFIISIKESFSSFRKKGKYKAIPFYMRIENILNFFVCSSWLIYAYILNDIHLLISNLIGTIFFFLWIIFIYFIYFRKINCLINLLYIILRLIYIPFILFLFQLWKIIAGPICVTLNIISFCSYILIIKEVVITKNYRLIQIKLNLLKLLNHLCWFIYGFMIINLNIVIPHVFGFVSIFVTAFFWNNYKKKSTSERLSNRSVEVMRNRAEFTI